MRSRISLDGGLTWSAESGTVVPNEGGLNVMRASFLRLKDGSLALFYGRKNSQTDCGGNFMFHGREFLFFMSSGSGRESGGADGRMKP